MKLLIITFLILIFFIIYYEAKLVLDNGILYLCYKKYARDFDGKFYKITYTKKIW